MRRFFAPIGNFTETGVTLGVEEMRHLRDVLRLRVGNTVFVFDGEGGEFECEIVEINKTAAELKIIDRVGPSSPESGLDLTLAVAVLKGEKFDLVTQKAVELGASRIIPLQTMRCEVKIKDAATRLVRWRKIALEATKQSGRARLTVIETPTELAALIDESAAENLIMFSERGGESFSKIVPAEKIIALIGPEGGWDDAELELVRAKGLQIVTLGGRILRAETAAIAVAAILEHRFGDLN